MHYFSMLYSLKPIEHLISGVGSALTDPRADPLGDISRACFPGFRASFVGLYTLSPGLLPSNLLRVHTYLRASLILTSTYPSTCIPPMSSTPKRHS